ncbi:MAG: ester cyclase [Firmicutes bacterium]|nr:ester cyclase [Bacillota bacterium]
MKKADIFNMIEDWVDAWNAKDIDRMKSMYAEDVILYQAPIKQALKGWDYIQDRLSALLEGFPDARIKINDLHIDGDIAILEFNETGTQTKQFLGYAPTGNRMDVDSCIVFRIRGGKIINHTTYLDTATILRSLGLIEIKGARPAAA